MPSVPLEVWVYAMSLVAAVGLTIYAVAAARPNRSARQLLTDLQPSNVRELTLRTSALDRIMSGLSNSVRDLGGRLTPASVLVETDLRIARAGLSSRWTADRLIAAKSMVSIAVFLVLFLVALASGRSVVVFLAVAIALIAFFVPDLVLVRRGTERDARIRADLADIVDQILIAVEAGASIDGAIDRVTRDRDGPLQAEFRRALQDVAFGMSRKDAMMAMATRSSVPELRELLTAIAQSEEHGLSIGNILRVQAAEIRDKRKTRAEEEAMKVPVKITFPLILFILPCLLAVIVGPAVVRIAQNLDL